MLKYLWKDFKRKMKSEAGFWNIAIPIALGAASSALSAATTKKGTGGQMGYDVITPPSVGEQSATGRYGADYWRQAMEGFATGEPWRGYGEYEALMKRKLKRGQTEAFYGTSGQRTGAYQTGMETGALAGLGGGRTQASLKPLQNQWTTGNQAIEEFLASEGAKAMQQREGTMLNYGLGLSQPYQQQVVPYMNPGTEATQSPWAAMLGGALGGASGLDWNSIASGWGKGGGTSGLLNAMQDAPYTTSNMNGQPITEGLMSKYQNAQYAPIGKLGSQSVYWNK